MAEGRTRADPSAPAGTARLPATRAAGDPVLVPSPGLGSFFGRFSEAVADAEHRLDVLLPDLFPDVLDVCIDRALVRLERDASDCVQQLSACEHPAGLPCHQRDDLKLAFGQVHTATADPRLHAGQIELDVSADA